MKRKTEQLRPLTRVYWVLQSLFVLLATYCISSSAAPQEAERMLAFLPCAVSFTLLTARVDSVSKKRFFIGDNPGLLPQKYGGYFKNAIFLPAVAVIAFVYLCNTMMIPNCNVASKVQYIYPFFFMFVLLINMTAVAHYLGLRVIKAHAQPVIIEDLAFVTPSSRRFIHNLSFQVARPGNPHVALLPPVSSPTLITKHSTRTDTDKDNSASKTILLHHERVPVEVTAEMIVVAYLVNKSVIVTLTNGVQRRYTGVLKEFAEELSTYPNFYVTPSWVANLHWVDRVVSAEKRVKIIGFKAGVKVRLTIPSTHVAKFKRTLVAIHTEGLEAN